MKKTKLSLHLLVLVIILSLCISLASPAFADAVSETATESQSSAESENDSAAESTSETESESEDENAPGFEICSSVDNEEFSLVLLIDRSGSMKTTDRSQFVKDAAKMLVDLCDEGTDSRIAVMSFDTEVYTNGFISILDGYNRELVKNQIASINYAAGGTDIGLALLTAVEAICSESGPEQNKMIILFTDGYTQDLEGKSVEESEAQLQQALELAVENDCRIFTIGTNYNGSMSQNGRDALEGIRDYQISNGVTNSEEELLAVIDAKDQDGMQAVIKEFERLYATTGERVIHEGNLVIESPNVSEANIIIAAPDGVSEIKVTNPSGESVFVDLNGGETILGETRIVYKVGKSYQLLKIIEPIEVGTWVLNVADKQSEPILNYTWMLTDKTEITLTLEQIDKNTVMATVRPNSIDTNNIRDFFGALTEKSITVTKKGEKEEVPLDVSYNLMAASLTATFPVEAATSYTVKARVSDGYFIRTCAATIKIPSKYKKNEPGPDIGTIYVWNWFSKTVDLTELIDNELQGLESVDGGDGIAEFEINGKRIIVRSRNSGSESIRIKSVLADGREVELTGNLKILNPIFPILLALLVVGLIVLFIYLKRQKRSLQGKLFFNFDVSLSGSGQYSLPEVFVPTCRVFSMLELIQSYRRDTLKPDWDKVLDSMILKKGSKYYSEVKKSKFTVCPNQKSFQHEETIYRRHDTEFEWTSEDGRLTVSFHY